MLTDVGGMSQTTNYTYDNNGNALTVKDPLTHVTTNVYDALNRRTKVTDANTGITSLTYDAHDHPLTVTDANNHVTSYVYDGFGDVIQKTSPDTGTSVYHYDSNGNLTQTTDALNVITNHTYDAINRTKTTTYPASATENVTYTYDETGHGKGIGRLTSLTDAAGTLSRSYEEHGNISSETRTRSAIVFTTGYTYDKNGRPASITYPSGGVQSFTYSGDGSLYSFPFTANGTTWNGYASHQPFGPLTSFVAYTYPTQNFYYDLDDRMTLTTVQDSTQAWMWQNYAYDANDNVTASNHETTANNQTFGYDVLNRLTSTTGGYGSYTYTLDKVGNRLTSKLGTVTTSYGINSANNRITAVGSQAITTNANGSITGISPAMPSGVSTLTYNNAGRLSSVKSATATLATYLYDAFGRRTVKTTGSTGAVYIYGPGGQLLEETDATGHAQADYIYADGRLANVWNIPKLQMVTAYTDRLGTPQIANDKYGLTAWKANYEPFGATSNIVTSNSFTGPVVENLRLPGQYADAESGFSQNGFRDYIPGWGRYLQSDPTGLGGGMNTYAYVNGNPLKIIDKKGLLGAVVNGGGVAQTGDIDNGGVVGGSINAGDFLNINPFSIDFGDSNSGAAVTTAAGGYAGRLFQDVCDSSDSTTNVIGTSANAGLSLSLTNANSIKDLSGPFNNTDIVLGLLNIQYASGYNDAGEYVGVLTIGTGLGLSVSNYQTNTTTILNTGK